MKKGGNKHVCFIHTNRGYSRVFQLMFQIFSTENFIAHFLNMCEHRMEARENSIVQHKDSTDHSSQR